jgi:NitT/TauT family transport system substrate-binding protein
VGTPQLGNTQDVAARAWLISRGHKVTMTGGDLMVIPTANSAQLMLFQRGDLDAVWTVEPWVTRLEREANARVYFEESARWEETGGRYVTTHLVARVKFLREQRELMARFIAAHVELTQWINAHPAEAQRVLNAELKAEMGRGLASDTLSNAWRRLEFTPDPVRASLLKSAEDAKRVGFLRGTVDLAGIYDLDLLNAALRQHKLPEVK